MSDYRPSNQWRQQPDILLNQAAPVQNTWYVVLPFTGRYTYIRDILSAILVANETVEIELTLNGVVRVGTFAEVVGTIYQSIHALNSMGINALQLVAATSANIPLLIVGHNAQVRARKTTALGAGNLQVKVVYAVV